MEYDQELAKKVIGAVASALRMDPSEITLDTFFVKDLNTESIDFLDIGFEIEKAVGKEILFREVVQQARARHGSSSLDFQIRDVMEFIRAAK